MTQRLRQVLLPATVNRLVYNSVLSWTGGWYFLVAAEFISTASSTTKLPGIGTYLLTAAGTGNTGALVLGLAVLIASSPLLDLLVWAAARPVGGEVPVTTRPQRGRGADRRVERCGPGSARAARLRSGRGVSCTGSSEDRALVSSRFATRAAAPRRAIALPRSAASGTVVLGADPGVRLAPPHHDLACPIYHVATGPIELGRAPPDRHDPEALGPLGAPARLAYAISLAIALPLAHRHRPPTEGLPDRAPGYRDRRVGPGHRRSFRCSSSGFPVASPGADRGPDDLTGMIWYLFFNILSGVRASHLTSMKRAKSYGLEGEPDTGGGSSSRRSSRRS